MSEERVDVVVFAGPGGHSGPEQMMVGGLLALGIDLVEMALSCPLVGRVVVATASAAMAEASPTAALPLMA